MPEAASMSCMDLGAVVPEMVLAGLALALGSGLN